MKTRIIKTIIIIIGLIVAYSSIVLPVILAYLERINLNNIFVWFVVSCGLAISGVFVVKFGAELGER